MELRATSIDGFLAYWCGVHEVRGEIHSVFQNTLNIKTSGGQLISILSLADLDGPNTVVTELPQGQDFVTMGLRSGMPVRLGGDEADVGAGALNLRIGRAQKWWPRLAGGLERLDMDRLRVNLESLLASLPGENLEGGLGRLIPAVHEMVDGRWEALEEREQDDLVKQALPGIRDLWQGTLGGDEVLLKKSFDELLGLGAGLTPSGDDVLLGFIGTLSIVSRRIGSLQTDRLLEVIRQHLYEIRNKTTFISANLLSYACAGRISSPILKTIRALLFEDAEDVRAAARTLVHQGAYSGSEILLGVMMALSLTPMLGEG